MATASALGRSDCNSSATLLSTCASLRSSLISYLGVATAKQVTRVSGTQSDHHVRPTAPAVLHSVREEAW